MLQRQFILQYHVFQASKEITLDVQKNVFNNIVHENHVLYQMEKRDRPNNLVRILVELHKLGATQEQLSFAYQRALLNVEHSLYRQQNKNVVIHQDNWQEFLGLSSYYGDYLIFFDRQLSLLGLEETLNTYFYSIQTSIGSQLQPLVQLAFGIENDLPEIITQALAYHASSYLDVSFILLDTDPISSSSSLFRCNDKQERFGDHILFDFISVDPRFDGKIQGNDTFQSTLRLLLKSKTDLIKSYMKEWINQSMTVEERLEALVYSTFSLFKASSSLTSYQLDWFLAGDHLISSILAIKQIIPEKYLENWLHLQFLTMLCTFIAQGRPTFIMNNNCCCCCWNTCISNVIQNSLDDPKLILTLASIIKLRQQFSSSFQFVEHSCLEIVNILNLFSTQNGTWIKNGLGWLN
ncbi:uncharacterized protein BX663DRAFT_500936 [Cokeromyces recurvatus]|uniref:uncharacterized protein n=1 Tax=Cokeromyces recurvatus TaxID=90255 RepID=UPI00221F0F85|nr:uncharacterized protein BX663DRAFT_500936 [Cokeromyces recurvatus]KAI7905797.1 hypothetical protein BX663DRAFT_500936 [Cokeromyces recurvatus]